MKKVSILGVLSFSVALVGAAHANPTVNTSAVAKAAKPGIRVVAGAKALSISEKADVSGKCGCDTPTDFKPGYGFGTTGHYGPPGQDFTPEESWRHWVKDGNFDVTPAGHPLPGQALTRP